MKIILRKSVTMLISLCLILLIACNANSKSTNTTENDSTEDMQLQQSAYFDNYSILKNINTHLIKEIKANIYLEDNSVPLVQEVSDGYIIGVMETDYSAEVTSDEKKQFYKNPTLYKIDKDGNLIWKQVYNHSISHSNMTNLATYDDGRILFSISRNPRVSMSSPDNNKAYLVQCDQDGNEIWKHSYDDYYGSLFNFLFITKDKEIITVGTWYDSEKKQTLGKPSSDIVVTYLDEAGRIIKQKGYGGEKAEFCDSAIYDPDIGVVFTGWTLSEAGDFVKQPRDIDLSDYIACTDESLNLRWVKNPNDYERYNYEQILIKDNKVYAVGTVNDPEAYQKNVLESQAIFLQMINKDGKEILKQYHKVDIYIDPKLCVLENNYVVLGVGNLNKGEIIVYNNDGEKSHIIDNLPYWPDKIISTADQGFIVKSIRYIKQLPLPRFSSSVRIDVEVTIMKYDSKYNLQWRKTYDEFKDESPIDVVIPLGNQQQIIFK